MSVAVLYLLNYPFAAILSDSLANSSMDFMLRSMLDRAPASESSTIASGVHR